ncbi:MAG: Hsp20/alpha crystallin family protein [Chloroflexota bacterium]|nr:MAG: Hsp20/alpha crystallin family protein [Chloroflexota bacterium]
MPIKDLIPWKLGDSRLDIRRAQDEDMLLDLRNQMARLFDDFFERPFSLGTYIKDNTIMGDFAPRMDCKETKKDITISVELPGMEPEDVEISINRNELTISGEKRAEKEEKGEHHYRIERSYGTFHRSIPIPGQVEENEINAKMKNGVLTVTLPKSKEALRKHKSIPIKTG